MFNQVNIIAFCIKFKAPYCWTLLNLEEEQFFIFYLINML